MAEIALCGTTRRFGDQVAVEGIDLDVADGELLVLLGPTGAGKTTTLRLIAGLETPDEGAVRIDGRDVTHEPPAARDLAFVFQQYSLYPHMTAYDNMAFPLRAPSRRLPEATVRETVARVAGLLRIEHKLDSRATRLSGGEMQRVAIGRALVREPAAYLMDEPLSSLDAKLRAELRLELKRIQREMGATIVYVTHDQIEAMTMADRIGVLREGRLVQVGTPREIYETPRDVYVASRLGTPAMNLLPAGLLPVDAQPPGAATVGARTEHLRIARVRHGDGDGTVTRIEHLGDHTPVHVALGEHTVVMLADATLTDSTADLAVGDRVDVRLEDPLFFDRDGERIAAGPRPDAGGERRPRAGAR